MPDFIELDGKFVNLDNVAYVSTIPGKINEPDTVELIFVGADEP